MKTTTKPEVRAALKTLDTILKRGDNGSQALWDILTALRGPDGADYGKKKTVEVRARAFPQTSEIAKRNGCGVNGAFMDPANGMLAGEYDEQRFLEVQPHHFRQHIYRARSALARLDERSAW